MKTHGFFAESAEAPLKPFSFDRRDVRSNDVAIEILYCGVCHSDLHQARNDWGNTLYPSVPGHEIVGRVTDVGSDVTRFRVGDKVAVGCMVDSCSHCDQCRQGDEQYCREGATWTYNGIDRVTKEVTFGGYSRHIVVRDDFVLSVPENLDLSRVAPILCAGITTYSPLRFRNVGPGSRVGVAGLGGLGHMAVKLAAGLGADVTVISRSKSKENSALALGADRFLVSTDEQAMKEAAGSFDLIIDTIPVQHDVSEFFPPCRYRWGNRHGRSARCDTRIQYKSAPDRPPPARRVDYRWHRPDPGTSGFLWSKKHSRRLRDDQDGRNQRGFHPA
jgi:uncharacterized zinc-type alcohol dehydrogenase-like protein